MEHGFVLKMFTKQEMKGANVSVVCKGEVISALHGKAQL